MCVCVAIKATESRNLYERHCNNMPVTSQLKCFHFKLQVSCTSKIVFLISLSLKTPNRRDFGRSGLGWKRRQDPKHFFSPGLRNQVSRSQQYRFRVNS